jgi:hypothetical protein
LDGFTRWLTFLATSGANSFRMDGLSSVIDVGQ